ncbi:hypothetical protein OJAV_G00047050 [Oryzias javanicus]|uniref:TNFR-Cys domain-containing protein n=1 Tax=Oryzias javanicus TaxID=123683 RepID=A0A3S2PYL6_ORYJA|nr:hypothetical protein OJAV_G00047050 [Oryzias javanicus]
MLLCAPFILFSILNGVLVDSNGVSCPPGHRIVSDKKKLGCETCKEGYFQPETTQSRMCKPCLHCDRESGSRVEEKCTTVKDTKCGCPGGFKSSARDSSICRCDKGFGLTKIGDEAVCSKCLPGYFNKDYNKPCQKWTDCKDKGVKVPGSSTSDVICEERSHPPVASTSASTKAAPLTLVHPRQQKKGTLMPKTRLIITTTTTPQPNEPKGKPPSNTSSENHFGLGLLMIGIAGLLLLTAVTCKLHFTPCWKKKRTPHMEEDTFCKPVKESGDGIHSSLHLNPQP